MVSGRVSSDQYQEIWERHKGLCAYCFGKAETMDHVIPLSRGGMHVPSNLVPACKRCNFEKHDSMPDVWIGSEVA